MSSDNSTREEYESNQPLLGERSSGGESLQLQFRLISVINTTVVPPATHLTVPELRELVDVIKSRLSFSQQSVPDLYIAQFFLIKSVSGVTQPFRDRGKRREKPRFKNILAYHCLWCGDWVGFSKEKARHHLFVDLNIKQNTCVEPGW